MSRAVIKDRYNEKDIRRWLPEACDPLIEIWAPELKKGKSYWQVGTSPVTRVKHTALEDKTLIWTSNATTITGTASENYEEIKTLGTCRITICNDFCVTAHVTKSENVAPFAVDGILGSNVLKNSGFVIDRKAQILRCPGELQNRPFSLLPANHYFPNYAKILREKIKLFNAPKEKNGERAFLSERRLEQARPYLPPEVNGDSRPQVIAVLHDFSDCLLLPGDTILPTELLAYPIKTKPNDIFAFRQPALPRADSDEIELIVKDLLRQNIIRVSDSPYNSPMGLTPKKPDARGKVSFRLCGAYGNLNDRYESETCSIPDIWDAVDQLHGSKFFSVLDLASASYHIPIEPQDCCKTAFTTTSGRYEFRRLPANMKNGPVYLQRMMNKVLEGITQDVFVCHDDMLIYTSTIEKHELRIRKVLERLRAHGLKLQPRKCQLFKSQVVYLGFLITDEGIRPDPAKIEKMRLSRKPDSVKALQAWLGLLSTHKRFFKRFVVRAQPMYDLLKNDDFYWSVEASENYKIFQQMLTGKLLLRYPDWNARFIVETGFDRSGIYAELMQRNSKKNNGKLQAIACDSRIYKPSEARLDDDERKDLASAWGLETFGRYLQNTKSLNELARNLSIKK